MQRFRLFLSPLCSGPSQECASMLMQMLLLGALGMLGGPAGSGGQRSTCCSAWWKRPSHALCTQNGELPYSQTLLSPRCWIQGLQLMLTSGKHVEITECVPHL